MISVMIRPWAIDATPPSAVRSMEVDATLEALEFALDELDEGVEYETAGGVLTLEFDNGSTMVFSRQPPVQQLWLAARSGLLSVLPPDGSLEPLHRTDDAAAIAFGDFAAGYTIAERPDLRILRDPFSAKPHVLFYATKRVGGDVSDFAAIKLLKFSVS